MGQILPFPIKFDANEWFILLNIAFGFTWVFFVPKRYPRVLSTLMFLYTVSVAILLDHAIATPPLDLYDINDQKTYELFDVITYIMYAPYSLLFVYLFDKLNPKGLYWVAYIVVWSLISTGFEWIAWLCHVFKYNNWNLIYSFTVYIVAATLQIKLFTYLLKYFNDSTRIQ